MKRRDFLKTSVTASALAGLGPACWNAGAEEPSHGPGREYYELRVYHLKAPDKRPRVEGYLEKAAIPALNRLGVKPVGVFVQQERPGAAGGTEVRDPAALYVLMPYASLEVFAKAAEQMSADPEYQRAGAEYLQAPKSDPAFERIESWLMRAFAGMPRLELPPYCRERKARMFELRTYESHSELKALKKVQMFNSGEMQTMREVGLAPVFYGQALIGSNLPHLTYMLSAENQEAHASHWAAFRDHPTWKALQKDPQYDDTVSRIYNRFLVPTSYSQL